MYIHVYYKYFAYKPPNKVVTNLQTVSFSCFRNSVRLLNVDSESNACGYSGAIHCLIRKKTYLSDLPNIIVLAAYRNCGMQINLQLTVFPSNQTRKVDRLLETRNNNPLLIFQNTQRFQCLLQFFIPDVMGEFVLFAKKKNEKL